MSYGWEKTSNLLDLSDPKCTPGGWYIAQSDGSITPPTSGSTVLSVSGFIPVEVGETYSFGGDSVPYARTLLGYDIDKNPIPDTFEANFPRSYTIPDGVAYLRISYNNTDTSFRINKGDTLLPYEPYGYKLTKNNLDKTSMKELYDEFVPDIEYLPGYMYKTGNLNANWTWRLDDNHVILNKRLSFSCKVEDFTSLNIGHGYQGHYGGCYVHIDNTNVVLYAITTEATIIGTYPHGLTIEDYLQIKIEQQNNFTAIIKINSKGNEFVYTLPRWTGMNGMPWVTPQCDLTDASFGWTAREIDSDIWLFGDSYFSYSEQRWPYYAINDGHINLLWDGYPGRNTNGALVSLNSLLKLATPKKIVWCLGMNDGDTDSAVNTNWNNGFNTVKTICEEKNIELILSTIPSCPIVNNKFKNEIVKASGYRYIDFAKAVGANDETRTWYADLLSGDNVHPSAKGAKVLYMQAMTDVPELLKY